jgi:hypothetical protein
MLPLPMLESNRLKKLLENNRLKTVCHSEQRSCEEPAVSLCRDGHPRPPQSI